LLVLTASLVENEGLQPYAAPVVGWQSHNKIGLCRNSCVFPCRKILEPRRWRRGDYREAILCICCGRTWEHQEQDHKYFVIHGVPNPRISEKSPFGCLILDLASGLRARYYKQHEVL
jgi:hypothetical protein